MPPDSGRAFPRPLELERTRLRRLDTSDAPAIFEIFSHLEVARYLSRPAMTVPAQADEWLAKVLAGYASGASLQLGIERKADGALIGACVLFNFHDESARAEIGYILGRPHWSRGYAQEALRAMLDHAFGMLGLNRIEADIDPRNAPSARVLERLGFRKEGYLRERWIVNGEASDTAMFGLLKKEWLDHRAGKKGGSENDEQVRMGGHRIGRSAGL